jgi:hypothetical protein
VFDDAPINSDEWWEKFRKRMADLHDKLDKISSEIAETTKRLRLVVADMILREIERYPEHRRAFIEKLHDPFYEPTPVDEIVIRKLLEKERNEQDLRE